MNKKTRNIIRYRFIAYFRGENRAESQLIDHATRSLTVNYGKIAVKSSGGGNELIYEILSKLDVDGRWNIVIGKVLDFYRFTDKAKIITLRYAKGLSIREICKRCFVCKTSLFKYLDEIDETALQWAQDFNLLKI